MATDANGQGGQPAAGGEGSGAGDGEGAGAGGGAPAGGAPPAGGGAPAGQPPRAAAPPPRQQQQPKPNKGGNGKSAPFDQHPGFRKRLNQEVERTLRRELGVSIEEAKKIIARGGTSTEGATGGAPAAGSNTAAETQALKQALEEQAARIKKLKRKLKRTKSSASAELTALEMKTDAIAAGVPEKYVRFALDVYRDLWRQHAGDPASVPEAIRAAFDRDPVDSRAVFAHIKAEHMPTASAAPPPPEEVPLDPSTSPPPSRAPGGEKPTPKQPGGEPPPAFDANKLSDAEWRRHKRSFGIAG